MKGKICFYEPNQALAEKFVEYWLGHGLGQYSICYYSDANKLQQDVSQLSADLWILDESLRISSLTIPSGKILWLTERSDTEEAVFKYCSAAILLHMIEGYLGSVTNSRHILTGAHLISLYSPVKRCLQSTFGITLAHLLSSKGRVLYLNLEGYSGYDQFISDIFSKDISDLIYYISQSTEDIPLVLHKFIYRLGEIDIIPPVLNPQNLQDVTEDMWLRMLHYLKNCELYDYIIVDVSDFISGIFSILKDSEYIFSLTQNDSRAAAKWQQYCKLLEETGEEDILKKTQYMQMPHITELPLSLECTKGVLREYVEEAAGKAGLL